VPFFTIFSSSSPFSHILHFFILCFFSSYMFSFLNNRAVRRELLVSHPPVLSSHHGWEQYDDRRKTFCVLIWNDMSSSCEPYQAYNWDHTSGTFLNTNEIVLSCKSGWWMVVLNCGA
jgi:hypothetical protein